MPLERELHLDGFKNAERLPTSLPWAVYHAVERGTDRSVRLAVLWPPEDLDADRRTAILNGFAEAGFQAQRLVSAAFPSVFSYQAAEDMALVASERPRGACLRDILTHTGPISLDRALIISARIASALAQAHQSGWAHGWLTPESVWLDEADNVMLSDLGYGLAAAAMTSGTHTPYRAPLGFFASDPARMDMQCLGLLVTETVTGVLPDPVKIPDATLFPQGTPTSIVEALSRLADASSDAALSAGQWAQRFGPANPVATRESSQPTTPLPVEPGLAPVWTTAAARLWPWRMWIGGVLAVMVILTGLVQRGDAPDGSVQTSPGASTPAATEKEPLTKIQVGPIVEDDIDGMIRRLEGMGFTPYVVRDARGTYLQVGAFASPDSARTTQDRLKRANLPVRVR